MSLTFSGSGWGPQLRLEVTQDLRAGLELKGIDVCALGQEGSERPLALIEMRAGGEGRVAVGIDVHDAVTEKRVLRDVDLNPVPDDGRGLTLAVAAEELLRASWAELAMRDAPAPAREPPPEVTQLVERSMAPALPKLLAARYAIEYHTGGLTLMGADVAFALWPAAHFGVEAAFQMRAGLGQDVPLGRVDSSGFGGSLAALAALGRRDGSTVFVARLGLSVLAVRFAGAAQPGAADSDAVKPDVHAFLVAGLRQRLVGALELQFDLGVGVPLLAVSATAGGQSVVASDGVQLRSGLGLGVRF